MNYDEYLKFKGSRLNEDQSDFRSIFGSVHGTVKVNFTVNFETEIYDDGNVALFVFNDDFQISKVFEDMKSAKAGMDYAMKLFKRIPWLAVEELKMKGFDQA